MGFDAGVTDRAPLMEEEASRFVRSNVWQNAAFEPSDKSIYQLGGVHCMAEMTLLRPPFGPLPGAFLVARFSYLQAIFIFSSG